MIFLFSTSDVSAPNVDAAANYRIHDLFSLGPLSTCLASFNSFRLFLYSFLRQSHLGIFWIRLSTRRAEKNRLFLGLFSVILADLSFRFF